MSALSIVHVPEPQLEFRFGQKLAYPRDGLFFVRPSGWWQAGRALRRNRHYDRACASRTLD
jgi:hypothetical protein